MLEKLTLSNFQKWRKLVLEFDPQVTTIVGPTDAGKSSVIRALAHVALNLLRGDGYIRHGRGFCKIHLSLDGRSVSRLRGKGTNLYKLDGKSYRAFGTGRVPDPVAALLRIGEVNFQFQLDPHFWFSETGGQISRNLNQIVNLDKIDTTLAWVVQQQRTARERVTLTNERFMAARREKRRLSWVPEFDAELECLELLKEEYDQVSTTAAALRSDIEQAAGLGAAVRKGVEATEARKELLEIGRAYFAEADRVADLTSLIKEVRKAEKVASEEKTDLTELKRLRKKADQAAENCRNLESLIREIKTQETELCEATKGAKKAEAELHKRTKNRCPICGRRMTTKRYSSRTYTSPRKPP